MIDLKKLKENNTHIVLIVFSVLLLVSLTLIVSTPTVSTTHTVAFTNAQKIESAASTTLNDTYIVDNEDTALTIWNKLNTENVPCKLIFGNLGISDEPITQGNRLWVVANGIAIDSGQLYADEQHQEGYYINTPQQYKVLKDALDDYQEAKVRYTYCSRYNTSDLPYAISELKAANERLVGEIS